MAMRFQPGAMEMSNELKELQKKYSGKKDWSKKDVNNFIRDLIQLRSPAVNANDSSKVGAPTEIVRMLQSLTQATWVSKGFKMEELKNQKNSHSLSTAQKIKSTIRR
jgi:hypothetical protein